VENLSKEKKVECVLRRALIYCQGMNENQGREEIVKDAVRELSEILEMNTEKEVIL